MINYKTVDMIHNKSNYAELAEECENNYIINKEYKQKMEFREKISEIIFFILWISGSLIICYISFREEPEFFNPFMYFLLSIVAGYLFSLLFVPIAAIFIKYKITENTSPKLISFTIKVDNLKPIRLYKKYGK